MRGETHVSTALRACILLYGANSHSLNVVNIKLGLYVMCLRVVYLLVYTA